MMPYYPQMLACVFHKQGLSPRQPPNGLQQQESTSIPYQHLLSLTHSVSPTLLVASLIARHPAQNHMLLLAVTSLYFLQLRNVPHLSLTFISLTLFFFLFTAASWNMGVLGPGVEQELQLWPIPQCL